MPSEIIGPTAPSALVVGGVSTLDGLSGPITLVAGAGITITDNFPVAGDITIAATGGGATATALATTGAPVDVAAAAPPAAGQILTATDATHSTWQAPAPAAAGTLTGATLNATVLASSLTSVGTLANLTVTNPITGSVTGASGSTTGNAATATSAAKWTTARNLAGNSVDGSANVTFANKFVVQGTTDAGLSAAQFLGALGTGIVKNTTTTGVLSVAVAGDFPTLNQSTTGSAATLTTPRAINGTNFDGSAPITTYPVPLFVQTADSTTTANVATTLFGTGLGSLTLPANLLVVGRVIRLTLSGYVSLAAVSGTHTLVLTLGGVTVATGTGSSAPSLLNSGWNATAVITCRTTGATGTVVGEGEFFFKQTALASANSAVHASGSAGPATVDTTGTLVINLTLNNGNATGTYTTTSAVVELIGAP